MSQIQMFDDFEAFDEYALARATALAMGSHRVPLSACGGWVVEPERVAREDGRFFQIGGVHIDKVKNREVSGWAQPMICGETDGRAALVVTRDHVLVRLRTDAGNKGILLSGGEETRVLVAPPLQFSQSNLEHNLRALRGELDDNRQPIKPVPLAGILTDDRFVVRWHKIPQDGARFFEKVDAVAAVRITSTDKLDPDFAALSQDEQADFMWVSKDIFHRILVGEIASAYLWMCAYLTR